MSRVERIRNDEKFKALLPERYKLIYEFGCETGLRIGDILSLKKENFKGNKIYIKEQKTGKKVERKISDELMKRLKMSDIKNDRIFNVSRQRVWKVFKQTSKKAKLRKNVGTHSMRKKKAYELKKQGYKDEEIQAFFNHDSVATTLLYLR